MAAFRAFKVEMHLLEGPDQGIVEGKKKKRSIQGFEHVISRSQNIYLIDFVYKSWSAFICAAMLPMMWW